jgi:hypothetical protein
MPERAARVVHSPPADSPGTHNPGTHNPGTHNPGTHSPRTHDPRTHDPRTHEPAPAAAGDGSGAEGLLLARRVPQAHLAPELRRGGQGPAASARGDGPLPDATEARAALSRYQASRQAARAVVDENGAPAGRADDEAGSQHPPAPGGWS